MIHNKVNDKAYIGVTTQGNPKHRLYEHICRFRRGDRDHKLYQAMKKYGVGSFEVILLCSVLDKADLPLFERAFIDHYDTFENGYNMTPGGDVVSDETRAKISAALKGRDLHWGWKIAEARRRNGTYGNPMPKGSDSKAAVNYTVMFPDGHIEDFKGLRAFCRKHSLSHNLLLTTLKGTQTHHKGFVLLSRFTDYPDREYTQASGSGAHPTFRSGIVEVDL
jgi:hypothetical protein